MSPTGFRIPGLKAWRPIFIAAAIMSGCANPRREATFDRVAATSAVFGVLDQLHHNASAADEESYFALFAPGAVFLGTDGTERWTLEEFRAYAHPFFEQGRGWTYRLRDGGRHIDFAPGGRVAWFDEVLDNDFYGETRGTGVLRLVDGEWRIAQYNLTIPVPNDIAADVVQMIRADRMPEESR